MRGRGVQARKMDRRKEGGREGGKVGGRGKNEGRKEGREVGREEGREGGREEGERTPKSKQKQFRQFLLILQTISFSKTQFGRKGVG